MRSLAAILLFTLTSANAQLAESLIFREMIYDFGEVRESQGPVDHEFVFTNNSGRPVKILSVQASCGCTTPEWTQTPVLPGRVGSVKARFDPAGRPGYFNKSLTLTTDLNNLPVVLQIKGKVAGKDTPGDFPFADGNLRFPSRSINFNKVFLNKDPQSLDFRVRNEGTSAVHFLTVSRPSYLKVDMPASLLPKEEGKIRVTYDARARSQFGFVSDNIQFTTDDQGHETKSFSVYATLEEFYPVPSAEELQKSPVLLLKESSVDLGRYRPGIAIERVIMARNTGKNVLQIKALQGNCQCISAEAGKKSIAPGDSSAIRIHFKPQNRGGTQQKAITVYSNDPRNPVQRIDVIVFVED